jgi:hypothetical protein
MPSPSRSLAAPRRDEHRLTERTNHAGVSIMSSIPSTPTIVQLLKQVPDPATDPFSSFYTVVRRASEGLGFRNYSNFITSIFCSSEQELNSCLREAAASQRDELLQDDFCFTGTRAYDQIREATDLFIGCQAALLDDCCTSATNLNSNLNTQINAALAQTTTVASSSLQGTTPGVYDFHCYDVSEINRRFHPAKITLEQLKALSSRLYAAPGSPMGPCCKDDDKKAKTVSPEDADMANVLTFMRQLRENQSGVALKDCTLGAGNCTGVLLCKLRCPPLLELIWSYWMEQGMLVQGLNSLTLRFQNRRPIGRDPLTGCDISPLRPLNNIFWGYVQRENDRLSLARRAYEYDHHYGLRLQGQAVPRMAPADSRTQFIEAFHRLLQEANRYYRTAMDTTMNADAFPVLNCLRELHLILAEGAHNQFGDLPSTARAEMLIQQWMMARPEVREFLRGRPGVPYPENWMPQMETLRTMMGWNDTSIRHYRDLATFGEQLLLSVRYLPWSTINDSTIAAGWLTFWRPEVQAYLHSYRSVTGVDLGLLDMPVTQGGQLTAQPSDLIGRRRAMLPAGAGM